MKEKRERGGKEMERGARGREKKGGKERGGKEREKRREWVEERGREEEGGGEGRKLYKASKKPF